ncbi:signal peptidase II [Candidatus Comchoanobacter bicostacola]|uniref:Lipoprotein signal peptidase n=1 Tax=Candidatus Comchoanobacter bicostacola TaxID=2919598 RepID=A0ABY5DLT0_9GAMM|nr:signal peptidase II [Candidatus Comchoanobacter bicostacola]UTC24842.1 signal peptidase II [Candidatus Comchoanobacter bicostacola]
MQKARYIWVAVLVVLDHIIKAYAMQHSLPSIPGHMITWVLVKNQGVSFGALSSIPPIMLILLQICVWVYIMQNVKDVLPSTLITAGFLGNLIDRVFYTYIIDMIQLNVFSFTWPFVFNIADIYISIAAAIILLKNLPLLNIRNKLVI